MTLFMAAETSCQNNNLLHDVIGKYLLHRIPISQHENIDNRITAPDL